jgi:DnaK suppressor protein
MSQLTARLPAIRRELLTRRLTLLGRVAAVDADLRALGENVESERADEAQEESTARRLSGLDALEQQQLDVLDAGLTRLDRGEYGHCLVCGNAIALARLEALPEAAVCVRCADRAETQRA